MSPDPLVGAVVLGRYRVDGLVAHGGMASVYRAHDPVLNRAVAVKILHPHLASDASCVERFRREALAAARLTHPGIVAIFDTGGVDGRPCLVMEYLRSGSLADLLRKGPLRIEEALRTGIAIARALHQAHEQGLVHRDVKPANILFSEAGAVKLGDFGIAKAGDPALTQTGQVIGTARYLAPEQLNGEPASPASDQFGLGVVLYETLSGVPPFGGPNDVSLGLSRPSEFPRLREVAVVPPAVDAAVMRALSSDPRDRFPDLAAFADALSAVGGLPGPARQSTRPPRARGTAALAVAGALALAGAGTLAAVLASRDGGASRKGVSEERAVPVVEARDFDPAGDRAEHPESVALAVDGDAATVWTTETYRSQFPALKPGVGIVLDLGRSTRLRAVEIATAAGGWRVEVRVADAPDLPATAEAFRTVASLEPGAARSQFDAVARWVLVWVVKLPPELRMSIAEIEVVGV